MLPSNVSRREQGLLQLNSWLWEAHSAEEFLLAQIRRVIESLGSPPESFDGEQVRSYLRHRDATLRAEAARCCVALSDVDSIPDLVYLLEDSEAIVCKAAETALQQLTGLGFSEDAQRWRTWWEFEENWHRRVMPGVLTRLQSGEANEIAEAIRQIAHHPVWRRAFVEGLSTVLQHEQASIRELGCRAAHLVDAVELAPDLRARLVDDSDKVREAAQAALSSWTRGATSRCSVRGRSQRE